MSKANLWLCLPMTVLAMVVCSPLHAADEQVHVVDGSELDHWWQIDPGHNPRFESPLHLATDEGCIVVAFEIHGDGNVSNQRVLRSVWTDAQTGRQVERALLRYVPLRRFVATVANAGHDPVYTYQVFTFTASLIPQSGADAQLEKQQLNELQSKCEIPDFPQQVQAMINAAANAKGATQ